MDEQLAKALEADRVIDITTTGRKTGESRRIEIWFHRHDGAVYITGMPVRPRSWYANMLAYPEFTFHVKRSARIDAQASAKPVVDEASRRSILAALLEAIEGNHNLDDWVAKSPLVEVEFN